MSFLVIFVVTVVAIGALFVMYLALSSCLGDNVRGRISGVLVYPRHGIYDHNYFRTMTHSGAAYSEHIEMDNMLNQPEDRDDY